MFDQNYHELEVVIWMISIEKVTEYKVYRVRDVGKDCLSVESLDIISGFNRVWNELHKIVKDL